MTTSDAGALRCPSCGGPAAPGDAACRYCRATLATVSCPACFALMFEGAVYCQACGVRRSRTAGSDRHAPCPSCRGTMTEVQVGEVAMLECSRCRSIWVDAATFEHICASQASQAAVLHHWPAPASVRTGGEVKYRKCVVCGTMMNRLNFGRMSGTIVDVCRGHGTLLDPGELHAVVRFIQGGGLDRARERQIADLKEQEQRLRQAQMARPAASPEFDYESWTRSDVQALLDQLRRS
jgi:Zn-finger nucleic acid-binding protein